MDLPELCGEDTELPKGDEVLLVPLAALPGAVQHLEYLHEKGNPQVRRHPFSFPFIDNALSKLQNRSIKKSNSQYFMASVVDPKTNYIVVTQTDTYVHLRYPRTYYKSIFVFFGIGSD